MFLALETKFLLFGAGQEQDTVLSRSPAPALQPPPSLGPTRSTLVTRPASTPALASAFPSAFVLPAPPTYLEIRPSPRKRPGNTRTGYFLTRRRLPGRMGIPWTPVRQGWGLWSPVRGGDLLSRRRASSTAKSGHASLAQLGCDRFRVKSQEGKELEAF